MIGISVLRLGGVVFMLALSGNVSAESMRKPTPAAWRAQMSELSKALSEAIPFLFPDPKLDSKALTEKVRRIHEITQHLDEKNMHGLKVADADPALPYIASMLREDIDRAYQSLQDGHVDYAKQLIRSSVSYCIACHTRTQGGAEFPIMSAFSEPLKRASWIEKIEFQAASRQLDTVVDSVKSELAKTGKPTINALDLERGTRVALSILVRAKQDVEKARELATAVTKSTHATQALKEDAATWIVDLDAWAKEKSTVYKTDQDLIVAARKLVEAKNPGTGAVPQHAEVGLLRASVLMHDLLKRFPESKLVAEALYIIAQSYDALGEIGLWSLHEMYYLACINKAPHSKLAEQCYQKYADGVTLGYTGSGGTNVPRTVRKHMQQIKKKATR